MHTLLFGWHTLLQLGKDFNRQYKQQIIIHQNIIQHPIKHKQINKQQYHVRQCKTKVHIWSLKSNTKLSPRHPQWSCHYERPRQKKHPSKKRFEYLLGHLSFWVSGIESPLIFLSNSESDF